MFSPLVAHQFLLEQGRLNLRTLEGIRSLVVDKVQQETSPDVEQSIEHSELIITRLVNIWLQFLTMPAQYHLGIDDAEI